MGSVSNRAVVIHTCLSVEDDIPADAGAGIDGDPGHDHRAQSDLYSPRELR